MRRGAFGLALILLAGALPAAGTVPSPERIAEAVAAANSDAERTQGLRFELRVQIGDRPAVARGVLISDPSGYARLELRGANGLVERHLLLGGQTFATRNGEPLAEHRFFLPPVYVLQARSGKTLRRSLEELDVLVDRVGLAECQEEDCLVVGDQFRDIPRRPPPPVLGLDLYEEALARRAEEQAAEAAGLSLEEWQELTAAMEAEEVALRSIDELAEELPGAPPTGESPGLAVPAPAPGAEPSVRAGSDSAAVPGSEAASGEAGEVEEASDSGVAGSEDAEGADEGLGATPANTPGLWVDRKSFAIRGMDSAHGVRVRLGPEATFNGVRVPGWIYIEEPGKEAVRLHVLAVSPVEPAPEALGPEWLMEPQDPATSDLARPPPGAFALPPAPTNSQKP